MAVVNVNSSIITNALATPPVLNSSYTDGGIVVNKSAVVPVGATDTTASTYRLFRIPSNARVTAVHALNDAITSVTTSKLGLYNINGGAIATTNGDEIFWGVATVSLAAARTNLTMIFQPSVTSGGGLAANIGMRVWELLGLTADPQCEYDVTMTITATATGAGNVAVSMTYVV